MPPLLRAPYNTYPSPSQASVSVVVGDLIIVGYSYASNVTTSTCSDTAAGGSNAYTRRAGTTVPSVGGGGGEVFFAIAKATETITITCTGISDNGIHVHVVSGCDSDIAAVLQDFNTGRNAVGASQVGGNVTTTFPDAYLFSYWYQENTNSTTTENGQGFTKQSEVTNHISVTLDQVVSSASTYHDAVTVTATTDEWAWMIAAFKGAGSAVVPAPMPPVRIANRMVGPTALRRRFRQPRTWFGGGGASLFLQAIGGTLTSAGALVKQTAKNPAGTLTSAGALIKQTAKNPAGTLTSAGALIKQTAKAMAGTLTSAGALTTIKTRLQSMAGTLTSGGALVKQTGKVVAGSLTSAGALIKQTGKIVGGTLTSAGAVTTVKARFQSVSGTLTSAGALIKQTAKTMAGTLTSAGALIKQTAKTMAGTLTSAGALTTIKTRLQSMAGTLTSAGALLKQTQKVTSGTLTSAGALVKQTNKAFAGTLTSAGALLRSKTRFQSVSGTLTSAATLIKQVGKTLGGALAMTATTGKLSRVSIGGTLTAAGSLVGVLAGFVLQATNVATARARVFVMACMVRAFVIPARMEGAMEWTKEIEKQSAEQIPYGIDYTDRLPPGKTVSSAGVVAVVYPDGTDATGVVLSGVATVTATRITQMVVGGVNGKDYKVTVTANLSGGGVLEDDLLVKVRDI